MRGPLLLSLALLSGALGCFTKLDHPRILAESRWETPGPDSDCAACHTGLLAREPGRFVDHEFRGSQGWVSFGNAAPAASSFAQGGGHVLDQGSSPTAPVDSVAAPNADTPLVAGTAAPSPRMSSDATPATPDKPAAPKRKASPRKRAKVEGQPATPAVDKQTGDSK